MNKTKEICKIIIDKYFYLTVTILCILTSLYFYKENGISIFNGIYIILGAYSIFKFFKKDFKIFNVFPKNKFILLISLVFLTSVTFEYYEHDYVVISQNTKGATISDAILIKPIESEIKIPKSKFDTIGIQFATYKRENKNAFYNITLLKNDVVIFTKDYNASEFKDSEISKIYVGKQTTKNNSKYKLIIKPIYADSDNCVSVYTNKKSTIINYQVIDNSLNLHKEILICSFIIIFISTNFIVNTKKLKPEKAYLLLTLYFIPLVFVVPPYDIPDEGAHAYRSYKLTEITSTNKKYHNMFSNYMSTSNFDCLTYGKTQYQENTFNKNKFETCLKNREDKIVNNYLVGYMKNANPVAHIAPAIGVKIADTITNRPLLIFMAGRIMNCIISIMAIYYAIKKSKNNKMALFFVATTPMFVQQMNSYSYDSLLNASCIIATMFVINKLQKESFSKLDFITMILSCLFIISSKYIYILLILPILFRKKYKSIKEFIKENKDILISLAISFTIYIVWKYVCSIYAVVEAQNISSKSNLEYILHNPLKVVTIGYNTLKMNGWFYIQGMFGYFGWFLFRFDNIIYVVYILMIILLLNNKNLSQNILNKHQKLISSLLMLVVFAGIFASMYFCWSTYGLKYVDGVQGRYFIPLLPLLMLSCIPKKRKDINLNNNDYYIFGSLSLLLYALIVICNVY